MFAQNCHACPVDSFADFPTLHTVLRRAPAAAVVTAMNGTDLLVDTVLSYSFSQSSSDALGASSELPIIVFTDARVNPMYERERECDQSKADGGLTPCARSVRICQRSVFLFLSLGITYELAR